MKTNQWFNKTLKTDDYVIRALYDVETKAINKITGNTIRALMNIYNIDIDDATRLHREFHLNEKLKLNRSISHA